MSAARFTRLSISGRGMLVNQGDIFIKHWTGRDVDTAVMHAELARIFDTP